jgi:nucleotide-binding universal stress UspA family protein
MICQRAHDVDADLIVMTSHGRTGLSRSWLGSVADAVLRRSAVPVLLQRPIEGKSRRDAAHHLFKHVLVPLDGSGRAAEILSSASSLARSSGARVTLLRAVQPVPAIIADAGLPFIYPPTIQDDVATARLVDEAKQEIAEVARRLRVDGVAVEAHVVVAAHIASAILDFARGHDVDVIAMTTHGRGASRLLIGSVADKVIRGSGLPMLLHRPLSVEAEAHAESAEPALATV